jgi:hypothetical protein
MKSSFSLLLILLSVVYGNHVFAQRNSELGRGAAPRIARTEFGNVEILTTPRAKKSLDQIQSAGMWDTNFASSSKIIDGGVVNVMLAVGDTLFIGGDFRFFNKVECFHIIQYDRVTKSFSKVGEGFNGAVTSLAWHKGKLYAGGDFTRSGFTQSITMNHLAVFDGNAWSEFGGGTNSAVLAMAFLQDSLYIGGGFTQVADLNLSYLAAWDGSSWTDESNGVNGSVDALYPVGDSIFVGGDFWLPSENLRKVGVLYNGLLNPMGPGVDGNVYSFDLVGDTLWVAGDFFYEGDYSQALGCLAAWDGNNWHAIQRDSNIGTNNAAINQVISVGDAMYILGTFSSIVGVPAHGIAKYQGGKWSSLSGDLFGTGVCAIPYDNTFWVGGRFSSAGTLPTNGIATYDGTNWNAVGNGSTIQDGYNTLVVDAIAADSKYIYFGGDFTKIGSQFVNHVAAWDKSKHQWTTLGKGVDNDVYAISIFGSDVYIGGAFFRAGSVDARHIALWNEATQTWSAMGAGSVRYIGAIASDSSGVYASVFFPLEGSEPVNYIGRWDGTSWNQIGGAMSGYANALLRWNGNLYMGGNIYAIDGLQMYNVAFYDGSVWNPMGGGFGDYVNAFAVYAGNLYAGGYFVHTGSSVINSIGMWDGQTWQPLDMGLFYGTGNGPVYSLTGAPDGLYVGGSILTAGTTNVSNLAVWDGTSWSDPSSGADNSVRAIAFDPSSQSIAIGGYFSEVGDGLTTTSYRMGIFYPSDLSVGTSPTTEHVDALSNAPNPFVNSTTFHLDLARRSSIRLEVFDELGRSVAMLNDKPLEKGAYDFPFDASNLPAGAYMCVLKSAGSVVTQKLILEH